MSRIPFDVVVDGKESSIDLSDVAMLKRQYNAFYRRLKYFGLQFMPNDEETVEDLIQDLWLKIWECKSVYTNEQSFRRYLFVSLHNAIVNYQKHGRVVRDYISKHGEAGDAMEEAVLHSIIKSEVYDAINSVFEELPDGCRRVYVASLEGKSQKEIAEMFNITVNTVKKHINNANHFMQRRLKKIISWLLLLLGH